MESNNRTPEKGTSGEWLAACGFIFPQDELALTRFNLLYGDADPAITGEEVNPYRILKESPAKQQKVHTMRRIPGRRTNKLVASKLKPLPAHILHRLKGGDDAKPGSSSAPLP